MRVREFLQFCPLKNFNGVRGRMSIERPNHIKHFQDYLVQHALEIVLEDKKPNGMKDGDWSIIQRKVVSITKLALAP